MDAEATASETAEYYGEDEDYYEGSEVSDEYEEEEKEVEESEEIKVDMDELEKEEIRQEDDALINDEEYGGSDKPIPQELPSWLSTQPQASEPCSAAVPTWLQSSIGPPEPPSCPNNSSGLSGFIPALHVMTCRTNITVLLCIFCPEI